jgi:hypothetical protein
MIVSAEMLPARRPELVIKPLGDEGQYVVKDPKSREFFHLGEEEHFLLLELDGEQTADEVIKAFEQQFHESLTEEDLHDFIEMTQGKGFLEETGLAPIFAKASPDQTLASAAKRVTIWKASQFSGVNRKLPGPSSWRSPSPEVRLMLTSIGPEGWPARRT